MADLYPINENNDIFWAAVDAPPTVDESHATPDEVRAYLQRVTNTIPGGLDAYLEAVADGRLVQRDANEQFHVSAAQWLLEQTKPSDARIHHPLLAPRQAAPKLIETGPTKKSGVVHYAVSGMESVAAGSYQMVWVGDYRFVLFTAKSRLTFFPIPLEADFKTLEAFFPSEGQIKQIRDDENFSMEIMNVKLLAQQVPMRQTDKGIEFSTKGFVFYADVSRVQNFKDWKEIKFLVPTEILSNSKSYIVITEPFVSGTIKITLGKDECEYMLLDFSGLPIVLMVDNIQKNSGLTYFDLTKDLSRVRAAFPPPGVTKKPTKDERDGFQKIITEVSAHESGTVSTKSLRPGHELVTLNGINFEMDRTLFLDSGNPKEIKIWVPGGVENATALGIETSIHDENEALQLQFKQVDRLNLTPFDAQKAAEWGHGLAPVRSQIRCILHFEEPQGKASYLVERLWSGAIIYKWDAGQTQLAISFLSFDNPHVEQFFNVETPESQLKEILDSLHYYPILSGGKHSYIATKEFGPVLMMIDPQACNRPRPAMNVRDQGVHAFFGTTETASAILNEESFEKLTPQDPGVVTWYGKKFVVLSSRSGFGLVTLNEQTGRLVITSLKCTAKDLKAVEELREKLALTLSYDDREMGPKGKEPFFRMIPGAEGSVVICLPIKGQNPFGAPFSPLSEWVRSGNQFSNPTQELSAPLFYPPYKPFSHGWVQMLKTKNYSRFTVKNTAGDAVDFVYLLGSSLDEEKPDVLKHFALLTYSDHGYVGIATDDDPNLKKLQNKLLNFLKPNSKRETVDDALYAELAQIDYENITEVIEKGHVANSETGLVRDVKNGRIILTQYSDDARMMLYGMFGEDSPVEDSSAPSRVRRTKAEPATPPDIGVKRVIDKFNTIRAEKTALLFKTPIIGVDQPLAGEIELATEPVRLTMTVDFSQEKSVTALAALLHKKKEELSLTDLTGENGVPTGTYIFLHFGGDRGLDGIYQLGQDKDNNLILKSEDEPRGNLIIKKEGEQNFLVHENPTEPLGKLLDEKVFGPALRIEATGPADTISLITVHGEGETFYQAVMQMWPAQKTLTPPDENGDWKIAIPYTARFQDSMIRFIKKLGEVYEESLKPRDVVIVKEGAIHHAPKEPTQPVASKPKEKPIDGVTTETTTDARLIELPGHTIVGEGRVKLEYKITRISRLGKNEKIESKEDRVLTGILVRDQFLDLTKPIPLSGLKILNGSRPLNSTLSIGKEPVTLSITRQAQVGKGDAQKTIWEMFDVTVAPNGNGSVTNHRVKLAGDLAEKIPAAGKIITEDLEEIDDALSYTFDVLTNPVTETREIYAVEVLGEGFGLEPKSFIEMKSPVLWEKGTKVSLVHPQLGKLDLFLTFPSGVPIIERDPLPITWSVIKDGDKTTLMSRAGHLQFSIPIKPTNQGARIADRYEERWFTTDHRDLLQAWLNFTGHPREIPDGKKLALLMTGELDELQTIRAFDEDDIPFYSYFLNEQQRERIKTAMAGPVRGGLVGESNVEITPDDSEFKPDQAWGIKPHTLFLPSSETAEQTLSLFRQGTVTPKSLPFPLKFVSNHGLVLEIVPDLALREDNVFKLGNKTVFRVYPLGHPDLAEDISLKISRFDQNGNWIFYYLKPQGADKVKAFEMRVVLHPQSPALVAVASVLNEAGTDAGANQFLQEASAVFIAHAQQFALAKSNKGLPSVFLRHKIMTHEKGGKILLRFASEGDSEGISKVRLDGFSYEENTGRLDYHPGENDIVLTILNSEGEKPPKEILKLKPNLTSDENVILLTTVLGSNSRRFFFNLEKEELTEIFSNSTDAGLMKQAGFPAPVSEEKKQGQGRRTYKTEFATGGALEVSQSIPEVEEKRASYIVPTSENIVEVKSLDELKAFYGQADFSFLTEDDVLVPDESTSWAQNLCGRDKEWMTFVAESGFTLIVPMEFSGSGKNGVYQPEPEVRDSVFGIKGSRVLIPHPTLKGKLVELTGEGIKVVHQRGHHIQLVLPDGSSFFLKRINSTASFSERFTFGFVAQPVGSQGNEGISKEARNRFQEWCESTGINRLPDFVSGPGEALNVDGKKLSLHLVPRGKGSYRLEGYRVDLTGERPQGFIYYDLSLPAGRHGAGSLEESPEGSGEMEVASLKDDHSILLIRDPKTLKQYVLMMNGEGGFVAWRRLSNLADILIPAQSLTRMVGISGGRYGGEETSADDNGAISVAYRWESEMEKGQKAHDVAMAVGRWETRKLSDLFGSTQKDVARLHVRFYLDKMGKLKATTLPLKEEWGKVHPQFPWDKNTRIEVYEDQKFSGRITVTFWHSPIQGKGRQEVVPYGWMTFKNREALLGAKHNFQVESAHMSHDFRYTDRKLHPSQRGYLSKRAGMNVGDYGPFSETFLDELGPLGVGIRTMLSETEARQSDAALLLSAMTMIANAHPDLALFDKDGNADMTTLAQFAAFAALELNTKVKIPRAEIIYEPGSERIHEIAPVFSAPLPTQEIEEEEEIVEAPLPVPIPIVQEEPLVKDTEDKPNVKGTLPHSHEGLPALVRILMKQIEYISRHSDLDNDDLIGVVELMEAVDGEGPKTEAKRLADRATRSYRSALNTLLYEILDTLENIFDEPLDHGVAKKLAEKIGLFGATFFDEGTLIYNKVFKVVDVLNAFAEGRSLPPCVPTAKPSPAVPQSQTSSRPAIPTKDGRPIRAQGYAPLPKIKPRKSNFDEEASSGLEIYAGGNGFPSAEEISDLLERSVVFGDDEANLDLAPHEVMPVNASLGHAPVIHKMNPHQLERLHHLVEGGSHHHDVARLLIEAHAHQSSEAATMAAETAAADLTAETIVTEII